ncbi:MAG: DUF928 domain-containing protein [Spirulina sp. SIO3F2]|nr:DUF928 domain-containing protein [Spirulina sp. SIO3F2]
MKPFIAHILTRPVGQLLVVGAALLGSVIPQSVEAIAFIPASDTAAPQDGQGGASRSTLSNFDFVPAPDRQAPSQGQGGASRGELQFIPDSDSQAPRQGEGGASRGEYEFIPASESGIPRQGEGGASRGEYNFIPSPNSPTPRQGEGGASRGEYDFIPASDSQAPSQGHSGGSRGEYEFIPSSEQPRPAQAESGSSRGEYEFIPASGRSAPEDSVSGASRTPRQVEALPDAVFLAPSPLTSSGNDNSQLPNQMLSLMPGVSSGSTVSGHPTFFFYLPESAAQSGVFRLKDESGALVYEQVLPNVHQAGVIAIQLPADVPELAMGQYYQWYVALQFDEHLVPASPFVSAWIERVAPPVAVTQAGAQGETLDYAAALASSGIWYDAIATLNTLRIAQPDSAELEAHWQELLNSVGLEVMLNAPITTYAHIQ